jgi:hypothetical protein
MQLSIIYAVVCTVLRLLLVRWRWLTADEVELLLLRHERRRLQRRTGGAVWRPGDRLWLAALSRCLPPGEWHRLPARPATLRRWQRELRHRRWGAYGCRRGPGRPPLAADHQALIVRLARENPRWGYVRIKGELLKLGHTVSATAIRMTLRRRGIPPAPERARLTWPVFLRAHAAGLLASAFDLPPGLGHALGTCFLAAWLLRGQFAGHARSGAVARVERRTVVQRQPRTYRGCAWRTGLAARRPVSEAERWPEARSSPGAWRPPDEGGRRGPMPEVPVTTERWGRAPPASSGQPRPARGVPETTAAGPPAAGRIPGRARPLGAGSFRAA